METIKIEYKDFFIVYAEASEKWALRLKTGEYIYENTSLAKVKEYLNSLNKKKFEPFKAYFVCGDETDEVVVTSIAADGYCWIKDSAGRRARERTSNIYAYDDSNKSRIEKLRALDKEYYIVLDKISAVKNELVLIDIESLTGEK